MLISIKTIHYSTLLTTLSLDRMTYDEFHSTGIF